MDHQSESIYCVVKKLLMEVNCIAFRSTGGGESNRCSIWFQIEVELFRLGETEKPIRTVLDLLRIYELDLNSIG